MRLQLAPTREGVDDDLTASLALWRPRDRTLKAGETCDGEGRHGKGQGEAWRLETSAELENVGVDPVASPEMLEAVVELLDAVGDVPEVEAPLLEGPPRRRRR